MPFLLSVLEAIENHYKRKHKYLSTQRARVHAFEIATYRDSHRCYGWVQQAIRLDIKGRQIVQRETRIKLHARALCKAGQIAPTTLTPQQQAEMNGYERELEALDKAYSDFQTELASHTERQLDNPLVRACKDTKYNDPFWFLTPAAIRECVRKGGCCGRSCKCCEQSRSMDRGFRYGHCTAECGCCIDYHGFQRQDPEEERNFKWDKCQRLDLGLFLS